MGSIDLKKFFSSMNSIRAVAFYIFCGISIAINLNMFLLLASSIFEKIVFSMVSVGIEGAKIYYIKTAPIYVRDGRILKAIFQYFLYAIGACLAILAAYGYISTTVITTDAIATAQSNMTEITNVKNDIETKDEQIKSISESKKSDKLTYRADIVLLDEQIKMTMAEIKKGKAEDVPDITWNWQVSVKNQSIENLKKQKTVLIDKNNSLDKESQIRVDAILKEKEALVLKERELEKSDAKGLVENKTDMFTIIGEAVNLPGKIVRTWILIFIAIMIELGIISTVPDPSIGLSTIAPKKEVSISPVPFVPIVKTRKHHIPKSDSASKNIVTVKKEELEDIFIPVEKKVPTFPFKPLFSKPIIPPVPKRTIKADTPIIKPVFAEKAQNLDLKSQETQLRSTPEESSTVVNIPKKTEDTLKKDITMFLSTMYGTNTGAGIQVDRNKARAGGKELLLNNFFDKIVNIKGNKGLSLFSFDKETSVWTANYSLSYLLDEIIPRIRFNFHEEKKQKI